MRDLANIQRQEQRSIAWREKSLLGRLWNAYDAGRIATDTGGRIGHILWAAVSRSARVDHMRQNHSEQHLALYQDLKHRADNRSAELRQRQAQDLTAAYEIFQASRTVTLRPYDQEQQDYRRLWAERNAARREAWRAYEAQYRPVERERLRHQRQQDNLRRIEDRAQQLTNREPRGWEHGREH